MAKYLVEIGTEELPYKFIPSAMDQLKESLDKLLKDNRIEYKNITTYGTPRRLTAIIYEISESQPDLVKKIKGPPAKVAMDDNKNLTPAGLGFAKKQGIAPEAFYTEAVGGVDYIFADVKEEGRRTVLVLQELIPDLILKLQGSHFMRWGDQEIKFSRPIRWIVSIMDKEEVPVKIGNIISSGYSRGHRFYADREIKINSPDTYLEDLYKAKVIADQKRRLEEVIRKAEEIARTVEGQVSLDPGLVEEVTYITEWPIPVLGSFDNKYLVIPQSVVVTVMASHQRYFPVFSKEGKLMNHFITMANYDSTDLDNVRKGNERVIKARLDDAIFFYTEDTRRTLESRIEDLKGVTFQKGLGTIHDKTSRIREIAYYICEDMNLDKETVENAERAALLCKADLVTSLVREFTELQGVIGSEYAKLDGEDEQVAEGIKEHYLPLSADGDLAESLTGQIVGISDKIDTICGVFGLGKAPTGSADPLGLRRAALGIILTLLKQDINVNLSGVIDNAISIQPVKIADKAVLTKEIRDFIIQRLRIYLNEAYRYDVVEAVLNARDPLSDIKDLAKRTEILSGLVKKDNYNTFHEAANRIHRIIKSEEFTGTPDSALFAQEIERQLWECTKTIQETNIEYADLVNQLEKCIPTIEKFFDEVLVMDPQMEIRQNRLALLGVLRNKFLKIADFSKIVS